MPNEASRLIMAALAVIAAGFFRGYSGLGFALITTTSLLLLFTPSEAVPAVLLLDIGASTLLMRQVWRQVSWAAIGWLLLGVVAGTLPGVWLLSRVPAAPMKLAVALCLLVLVGLLRRGRHPHKAPGRLAAVATVILSGLLNGVGAVGGPPVFCWAAGRSSARRPARSGNGSGAPGRAGAGRRGPGPVAYRHRAGLQPIGPTAKRIAARQDGPAHH